MTMHITVISTARNAGRFAERCTRSVLEQTFEGWRHIFVDASDDMDMWNHALRPYDKRLPHDPQFEYRSSDPERGPLENFVSVARELPDDEIIVWLDGDDWLAVDCALQVVHDEHEKGALATYGQFMTDDGYVGFAAQAHDDPRQEPWRATHLKTMRAGLVKRIKDEDLRWPDGCWLDRACDMAVMFPVLEMAGPVRRVDDADHATIVFRHWFVPRILCVYNTAHARAVQASAAERRLEEEAVRWVRSRPRYERVPATGGAP